MNSLIDFNQEVKIVSESVRRICFEANGVACSPRDTILLEKVFTLQYFLLSDLNPGSTLATRRYSSWIHSTSILDVYSFGLWRKEVSSLLRRYPELLCNDGVWTYTDFKHQCASFGSYWSFMAPIKELIEEYLINPSPASMYNVLQWVDFSIKINLRDVDFKEKMLSEYLSAEQDMRTWTYDESVIRGLNTVLREWFRGFYLKDLLPQHGPGSVAEYRDRTPGLFWKYVAFATDPLLEILGKRTPSGSLEGLLPPIPVANPMNRISELLFVPKSMVTNRTISKEPAVLQYFQQAVKRQIVEFCEDIPEIRSHIAFSKQELSAELARDGSFFGEYATIDLSAASDSVTLSLVKKVFRGTHLLAGLICPRSTKTLLPSGTILDIEKYAPMGSALCFPVETLVFAAACELACRLSGLSRSRRKYKVYGDDIVITSEAVESLLYVLSALHFKVNMTKSFMTQGVLCFREACGGEYLNGHDVTPVRCSRKLTFPTPDETISPDKWDQQVGFLNRLFTAHLFQTRKALISLLRSDPRFRLAWNHTRVTDDYRDTSAIFVWPGTATNFNLISLRRDDRKLFRSSFQSLYSQIYKGIKRKGICQVPGASFPSGDDFLSLAESIRLFEWHRRAASDPRRVDLREPILTPIVVKDDDVWPHKPPLTLRVGGWSVL